MVRELGSFSLVGFAAFKVEHGQTGRGAASYKVFVPFFAVQRLWYSRAVERCTFAGL